MLLRYVYISHPNSGSLKEESQNPRKNLCAISFTKKIIKKLKCQAFCMLACSFSIDNIAKSLFWYDTSEVDSFHELQFWKRSFTCCQQDSQYRPAYDSWCNWGDFISVARIHWALVMQLSPILFRTHSHRHLYTDENLIRLCSLQASELLTFSAFWRPSFTFFMRALLSSTA